VDRGDSLVSNSLPGAEQRIDLNVESIMMEIREKVRMEESGPRYASSPEILNHHALAGYVNRLASLDREIRALRNEIGTVPPVPPTLRGRVGALAIRLLRRLFWWQSFAIRNYVAALARRHEEERRLLSVLAFEIAGMQRDLGAFASRLSEIERAQLEIQASQLEYVRHSELRR
jgi:hypothetical protein